MESSIISIENQIADVIIRKFIRNSGKIVGSRIGPCETRVLLGYSCKVVPFRTTLSHLFLRNDEITLEKRPKIPQEMSLSNRSACQSVKSLGYIKCNSSSSPRHLHVISIPILLITKRGVMGR